MNTPTADGIVTRHPASAPEAAMVEPRELRALRMRKGLTIFDVADLVGLDPMTVAAIEDGSTRASDSLLAEWDDALQRAPSHPLLWRIRRAVFHSPWDFVILALFALALVVAVALVRGR